MTTTHTPDTDLAAAPSAVDPDLLDAMRQVLSSAGAHGAHGGVDAHGHTAADDRRVDPAVWDLLVETGLSRLTGSEESGGSGAGWLEAAALLTTAASLGTVVPVVEHDLMAGWLLERVGLAVDERRRTVALLDESGFAAAVPWARSSDAVVCVWPVTSEVWRVADVPVTDLHLDHGRNLSGEERDSVRVDLTTLTGVDVRAADVDQLRLRGALARAVQVAGALEQCLSLVREHVTTRHQFGRPLARFQAVQHMVADLAGGAALARAACDAAVRAAETSSADLAFRVAVARSCSGHAASRVARTSHQLLGAIGTTQEHELHLFTLSALAWRSEYGSTAHWDAEVARAAADAGAEGLWELIAG